MKPVRGDDRGETLIEVLVALVILGLAAVAIMTGLALSASLSGKDRGRSSSATYVRDFAEQIQKTVANGGYDPNGSYSWTPPSSSVNVTVASAKCLTKASASTLNPSWGSCPADGNIQMLTLKGTAANGANEFLTIVVRKPCTGAAGDAC
ncbi:hypothetical protein GCM10028801_17210 [Nocardioides maradonensis]